MIKNVEIRYLNKNVDERGWLMPTYNTQWDTPGDRPQPVYTYVAKNYPGVIRAWHYHKEQDDYWVVVNGVIKAVLYDPREDSNTYGEIQEFYMGDDVPIELKIPVGVYHGYKTVGQTPSLLINNPTKIYNSSKPDEYRIPYNSNEIPYDWDVKID